MEDFLRNKLNEFEESNDGWDRPDPQVWERAQGQLHVPVKPAAMAGNLAKVGVLMLLLALGGSTWYLHQTKSDLQGAFDSQQEQLKQLSQQIASVKERQLEELQGFELKNGTLQAENKALLKQNSAWQKRSNLQNKVISKLRHENQGLQSALSQAVALNIPKANKPLPTEIMDDKTSALIPQDLHRLPGKQFSLNSSMPENLAVPAQITPAAKHWKKFEVGYEYALLGLKIPVESDFKGLNSTTNNANKVVYTHSHGANFAFSIKPNWYVRTGLRTAQMSLEQTQELGVFYNKSSEYLQPNGTTANDINLAVRTPYNELESEITLSIPTDANLITGDWLVFGTYERILQRHYQVPLGVSYFHGQGRLQWHLQAGMQWNMVVFEDYFLKAYVQSKTKVLPVDKVKLLTKEVPSTQYLGAYAGFGINYQLSESWHIRSGLTYSYDFNNKSNKFSNSNGITSAITLGLNYRF